MDEVIENKQVILGNTKYEYTKTKDNREILRKTEIVGKNEINIILKDVSQGDSMDIENYIIDVLSDLYIKNNINNLMKN